MNKYDSLLNAVASSNLSTVNHPFRIGDKLYATDGHVAVAIPASYAEGNYKDESNGRLFKVLSNHFNFNENLNRVFTTTGFLKTDSLIPKIIDDTCPACGGDGTVAFYFEWEGQEYESEDTCPICLGDGTYSNGEICEYQDDKTLIDLGTGYSVLKFDVFKTLLEILDILNVSKITLVYQNEHPMYAFKLDDGVLIVVTAISYYDKKRPVIKFCEE